MKKFIESLDDMIIKLKDMVEESEKLREFALNLPIKSLEITAYEDHDHSETCTCLPAIDGE